MSFGIDNPAEGAHVPGATCPACMTGYPKPCAPPVVDRVTAGKVSAAEQKRQAAARCPGSLHGEMIEGLMHQRCDTCGIPEAGERESQTITAADVGVVKPEDLGVR